jgi:hypothetical protein
MLKDEDIKILEEVGIIKSNGEVSDEYKPDTLYDEEELIAGAQYCYSLLLNEEDLTTTYSKAMALDVIRAYLKIKEEELDRKLIHV